MRLPRPCRAFCDRACPERSRRGGEFDFLAPWCSFRHYLSGIEGAVEIESQWTARKREQLGVVPGIIRNQIPRPVSAKERGDKDGATSILAWAKGWASPRIVQCVSLFRRTRSKRRKSHVNKSTHLSADCDMCEHNADRVSSTFSPDGEGQSCSAQCGFAYLPFRRVRTDVAHRRSKARWHYSMARND